MSSVPPRTTPGAPTRRAERPGPPPPEGPGGPPDRPASEAEQLRPERQPNLLAPEGRKDGSALTPVAATQAATVGGAALATPRETGAPPLTLSAATAARRLERVRELGIGAVLFVCGALSILTTAGIVAVLIFETIAFFREVSIIDFLTDTQWTPLFAEQHFGILPLLNATVFIALGSMVVALPLGLGSAVYLNEYAPPRVRAVLKPVLEVLAGIPTVVYGYFALLFITPLLRLIVPETQIFNAFSAMMVMGIMILPMVSSLSEDAMNAVPVSLREASLALGATRFETSTRVVIPAALSGIAASFILAISRAIGETMIVTIAAGQMPQLSWNPLEGMATMTAYIVQVSLGDTPTGSLAYKTIFAVGMTLFVLTLLLNFLSQWFVRRFREVYE